MFLKIRDAAKHHLHAAGAVRADKLINSAGDGDSWVMLACIDRLVELGELRELKQEGCWFQYKIYTEPAP